MIICIPKSRSWRRPFRRRFAGPCYKPPSVENVPTLFRQDKLAIVGEFLKKDSSRDAPARKLDPESRLVTDGSQSYRFQAKNHESVNHTKPEWKRGDVHTNTVEGFFSIFKRGLVEVYQHMDQKHLDRYLAEFDFRQNTRARLGINDTHRAAIAVEDFKGKRLTYPQPDRA